MMQTYEAAPTTARFGAQNVYQLFQNVLYEFWKDVMCSKQNKL